jgi:hypothetical protein
MRSKLRWRWKQGLTMYLAMGWQQAGVLDCWEQRWAVDLVAGCSEDCLLKNVGRIQRRRAAVLP